MVTVADLLPESLPEILRGRGGRLKPRPRALRAMKSPTWTGNGRGRWRVVARLVADLSFLTRARRAVMAGVSSPTWGRPSPYARESAHSAACYWPEK